LGLITHPLASLGIYAVSAAGAWALRALSRVERTVEVPHPPLETLFSSWDDLVNQLSELPFEVEIGGTTVAEKDHFFIGTINGTRRPCLIHRRIVCEGHVHAIGTTGGRKTHGLLMPTIAQIARRRDTHIVVIDLKGDLAFFSGTAIEARRARVNFKWFT